MSRLCRLICRRFAYFWGGDKFLYGKIPYGFKPGRHGPDAPPPTPTLRSLPLHSASAPGAKRVQQVMATLIIQWLGPGEGSARVCGASPHVKPATAPRSLRPRAHRLLSCDRQGGKRVAFGRAGEIGFRDDPGGPTTPLGPLSTAGQGPAEGDTRLPSSPLTAAHHELGQDSR